MFHKKLAAFAAMTAVISLLVPTNALAANLFYEADTTIAVGSINLVILAGSRADLVEVRNDSVVITVGTVNETLSIVSNNNYQLNTSPSTSQICGAGQSRVNINNNTVTITPVAQTASCPSTVLAPSGGGGGAPTATTTNPTPAPTVTVAAYDVPDNGVSAKQKVLVVDAAKKITLQIAGKTKFWTDVVTKGKREKKVLYGGLVYAPLFVEASKVKAESTPKGTKVQLAVQADTAKQVKLTKRATLSIPISDALELLGAKVLKAYYVDENSLKAKKMLGGKIDKKNNLYVVKPKYLGGMVILVEVLKKK